MLGMGAGEIGAKITAVMHCAAWADTVETAAEVETAAAATSEIVTAARPQSKFRCESDPHLS